MSNARQIEEDAALAARRERVRQEQEERDRAVAAEIQRKLDEEEEKEELERQRLEERHLREQIRINNEKLDYETEIHKAMLAAKREKLKAEQLANADDISKRFSQDELINFIESQKLLFAEVERQQAAQRQQRLEAGLNAEAPLEPLNIDPEVQKRVQQSILAAKEAAEAKNRLIDPDQLFARQRVALQQGQQQLEQSVNQRAALMHGQVARYKDQSQLDLQQHFGVGVGRIPSDHGHAVERELLPVVEEAAGDEDEKKKPDADPAAGAAEAHDAGQRPNWLRQLRIQAQQQQQKGGHVVYPPMLPGALASSAAAAAVAQMNPGMPRALSSGSGSSPSLSPSPSHGRKGEHSRSSSVNWVPGAPLLPDADAPSPAHAHAHAHGGVRHVSATMQLHGSGSGHVDKGRRGSDTSVYSGIVAQLPNAKQSSSGSGSGVINTGVIAAEAPTDPGHGAASFLNALQVIAGPKAALSLPEPGTTVVGSIKALPIDKQNAAAAAVGDPDALHESGDRDYAFALFLQQQLNAELMQEAHAAAAHRPPAK